MQEADSARRLAILRGETPPPLPEAEPEIDPSDKKFARRDRDSASGFSSRKRKRAGEDDTDFEMRLVRERAEAGDKAGKELGPKKETKSVEIVGKDGHINLVGAPVESGEQKNEEQEREKERKKREMEDQYTMRFSNAAGRDGFSTGDPWYARPDSRSRKAGTATKEELDAEMGMEASTKNVWGRDDPQRKARETQRLTSNDPLAMMKMGARKVREIEKERRKEDEEREQELQDLRRDERRREKRRRKERHEDEGEGDRHRDRHRSRRSEHSRRRHHDDEDLKRGEERHHHGHDHRPRDDKGVRGRGSGHPKEMARHEQEERNRCRRPDLHGDEGQQPSRRHRDDGQHTRRSHDL